jgi:hypothetical protein
MNRAALLQKIAAIARTEIRFGLRRGLLVIGMGAVCGLFSVVTFWLRLAYPDAATSYADIVKNSALIPTWPILSLIVPLVLPVVSILSLPADREYRTDLWLRCLPIDGGVYLAGKVLGTLAVVLGIWTAWLLLHFCIFRVLIGPIDLFGVDMELVLVSGLPLLVWNCVVGVLAGTWLRSRRTAILAGVLTGFASMAVWGMLFSVLFRGDPFRACVRIVSPMVRVAEDTLADFVLSRHNLLPANLQPVTGQAAIFTLLAAGLVLSLLALAARQWLLWKDNF